MSIGQKIKALLNSKGIKQIKFAEALGISPSRLSNYLKDKREPDLAMLARMARFLGVDVNYFADMEAVNYFANMEAVAYPIIKDVVHTGNTNAVEIPVKRLNAKRYSHSNEVICIDNRLLDTDISDVLAIDVTEDITKPLIIKGDHLLVCPISKHAPKHGDFIIVTGRHYKVYQVWMYKNEPFIIDIDEKQMQKLSDIPNVSAYIILLFIRRAKNY